LSFSGIKSVALFSFLFSKFGQNGGILAAFAPQGQHGIPIKLKFGTEE